MSLSNYPPGHPTGVDVQTLRVQCGYCGAATEVTQTYERDVNATTVEPDGCARCGRPFDDADYGAAEYDE